MEKSYGLPADARKAPMNIPKDIKVRGDGDMKSMNSKSEMPKGGGLSGNLGTAFSTVGCYKKG